jgi:predicted nucleic acid-binding protein
MTAPVFVDTNVFVYAVDESDPAKTQTARLWLAELSHGRAGRTSFQVLQEFYLQVAKKSPASQQVAREAVTDLLLWDPVAISGGILLEAWNIQDRYRFSFWDALIVAAAKAANCGHLLTEDLQDNQAIDGVVIIDPFSHPPSDLLSVAI